MYTEPPAPEPEPGRECAFSHMFRTPTAPSADTIPEASTLNEPPTDMNKAPPPAPPLWPQWSVPPPEPHAIGAKAEPYSHVPQKVLRAPHPACEPPPPLPSAEEHGPVRLGQPPPVAVIVPPTVKDPLLTNVTLSMTDITEPEAIEKTFVELTKPPVIVHDEPVNDSVLLAKIEDDVPKAKVLLPVNNPSDNTS